MSSDEVFLTQLAAALENAKLEAIVVGSIAAVLHGSPITTQDVDLLIRDSPKNHKKVEILAAVLGGSKPTTLSDLSRVVSILGAGMRIDILFDEIAGNLKFESVRSRSVEKRIGQHRIKIAALSDIIRSKEAADRPKDRIHLELLYAHIKLEREQ